MAELSLNLPVVGEKDTTAEPKVTTALTEIQTQFNGKIAAVNLEAKAVTEEKLSTALKEGLITTLKNQGASAEIKAGEFWRATATITVTLPAPTAGARVAIFNANGETTVKQHAAEKIYGDFLSTAGVTEFKLGLVQHVELVAEGANWMIAAGEPKREQKYAAVEKPAKAEWEAGKEVSATRPSIVNIFIQAEVAQNVVEVVAGGKAAGFVVGEKEAGSTVTVWLNPGEKWQVKAGAGPKEVQVFTKLL